MSEDRPDVASWSINSRKITAFLLRADHRENQGRDRFFRSFGFTSDNPEALAWALMQHPRAAHGFAYRAGRVSEVRLAYDGRLETLDGRGVDVRTIWSDHDPPTARSITVVPLARLT